MAESALSDSARETACPPEPADEQRKATCPSETTAEQLAKLANLRARLRDAHSILVRDFSSTQGLEGCLRITVGTPQENDRVVEAVASVLKEVS